MKARRGWALLAVLPLARGVPEQIHLAFGGAGSGGRTFSWFTASQTATSTVKLWTAADQSDLVSVSSDTQLGYLEGFGFHHHVTVDSVRNGSAYSYSVGDDTDGFSDPFTFTTKSDDDQQVNIALFGDWGYLNSTARKPTIPLGGLAANWTASYTHDRLMALVEAGAVDSVFHLGDVSYADDAFGHAGELFRFDYERVYSDWMNWIEPVAAAVPYHVTPGNHESECHSPYCVLHFKDTGMQLNNFTAYNNRWRMPSQESNGVQNMWYSWRQGNVHIVSINTETDQPGAAENEKGDSGIFPAGQFAEPGSYVSWLEQDLKAASQDPTIDWIIAGGHRWSDASIGANVTALFAQYDVDMFFAGHAHSYTRYNVSSDGVVHVTVGGAGNDEHSYPDDSPSNQARSATARCLSWCSAAEERHQAKAQQAADALGQSGAPQAADQFEKSHARDDDPCQLCAGESEFFTDQYAIGVLSVMGKDLSWQLLKSEDGSVLDALHLSK